jgi:hypothetical protein
MGWIATLPQLDPAPNQGASQRMKNGNTVNEKSIKSWLDIAPHYIGFFLAFLKSPSTALLSAKGTSEISPDLVSTGVTRKEQPTA